MVFNLVEALRDALAEETLGGSGEGTAGDPAAREGARGQKPDGIVRGGGADADGAERARRTEPGTRSGTSTTSAGVRGLGHEEDDWEEMAVAAAAAAASAGDAAPRGLPPWRGRGCARRRGGASRRSSRSRSRRRRRGKRRKPRRRRAARGDPEAEARARVG